MIRAAFILAWLQSHVPYLRARLKRMRERRLRRKGYSRAQAMAIVSGKGGDAKT